jgi:hypothetical protein
LTAQRHFREGTRIEGLEFPVTTVEMVEAIDRRLAELRGEEPAGGWFYKWPMHVARAS